MISQALFYVLFLQKNGEATCKFLSAETADDEDAAGLMEMMTEAFDRFGIVNFNSKLAAAGMDRASVNMGKNTALAARLKVIAPWLTVVHFFDHCLKLPAADAFTVFFLVN